MGAEGVLGTNVFQMTIVIFRNESILGEASSDVTGFGGGFEFITDLYAEPSGDGWFQQIAPILSRW